MNRHIQQEHQDVLNRPLHCDQCPMIFRTDEQGKSYDKLKKHRKTHEKISCEQCGATIAIAYMYRHIEQYHTANEDKKYKCPYVAVDLLINMHEMIILMFIQVKGHISVNIARQHLRVRALWAHIKEPIWA